MDHKEVEEICGCRYNEVGDLIFEVKWKNAWIGGNLLKKLLNGNIKLISQMDHIYEELQKNKDKINRDSTLIKTEPLDDYSINETTLFLCNICNGTFDSPDSLHIHQSSCVTLVSRNERIIYDNNSAQGTVCSAPFNIPTNIPRRPVSDIVDELRKSKAQECEVLPDTTHNQPSHVDVEIPQRPPVVEDNTNSLNIVGLFECENCRMTFADADYLARHQARCKNHKFSTIRCEICQRGFTTKGSLELHVDAVHLKKKEFGCTVCGKQFARKHILKVHLTTHTGQCDFQCTVCGKSFKQKSNLNRHERIHESKNFGYRCRFCGQAFTQNKHLKKHMSVMHPNKTIETKSESEIQL